MQDGDSNGRTWYENSSRQKPHFLQTVFVGDAAVKVILTDIYCSQEVLFCGIYAGFYTRGEYVDTITC